jgi:hypothetical protein
VKSELCSEGELAMDNASELEPQCPVWLQPGEFAYELLERFLRQCDNNKRAYLKVSEKTAPQLYDFNNDDYRHAWGLILSLETEFGILAIKPARVRSGQEVFEGAQIYLNPEREALVRSWLQRPRTDPYLMAWQRALEQSSSAFEDGGEALRPKALQLPGKSAADLIAAFARIAEELEQPLSIRSLSARCFWGDSKFLDGQQDLVRGLFPDLSTRLIQRPVLLPVHLPDRIEQILFVENQDSFVELHRRDYPGLLVIYMAGFRGSASRVRTTGNVVFTYTGTAPSAREFEAWWFQSGEKTDIPHGFWGDLDFAGMAILKSLRLTFPEVTAWKPGYEPMLELLRNGHGHGFDWHNKGEQSDPGMTGCAYADHVLLPAIRSTQLFIDQEAVGADQLHSACNVDPM